MRTNGLTGGWWGTKLINAEYFFNTERIYDTKGLLVIKIYIVMDLVEMFQRLVIVTNRGVMGWCKL